MDFAFTEEQNLMADSLRKAYESEYDFDKRRAVLDDTATFYSPTMWQTLAENGFIGLLAPEDVGGFDGGGAEIMAVATEMARHLALEPFLGTSVMGVRLLVSFGTDVQKYNILPQLQQAAAGDVYPLIQKLFNETGLGFDTVVGIDQYKILERKGQVEFLSSGL